MSTKQDAITFLDFIKTCFLNMDAISEHGSTIVTRDVTTIKQQYYCTQECDHKLVLKVGSDVQCYKNAGNYAVDNL